MSHRRKPYSAANPLQIVRYTKCSHYKACLSMAAEKRWDGFSCNDCPLLPAKARARLAAK